MWRYNPGIGRGHGSCEQRLAGDIYLVRGTINTTLPRNADPNGRVQRRRDVRVGLSPHWTRWSASWPAKQRDSVFAQARQLHGHNLADNTVAVFGFGNATGIITSATLAPNAGPHRFFEILGTSGEALLKPIRAADTANRSGQSRREYAAGNQTVKFPVYRRYVGDFKELAEAVRAERPLTVSLERRIGSSTKR
jgi:predicted dehydrogenase